MQNINPDDFKVKDTIDLSKLPTELTIETSKKD